MKKVPAKILTHFWTNCSEAVCMVICCLFAPELCSSCRATQGSTGSPLRSIVNVLLCHAGRWGVCVALSALMSCAFSFHPPRTIDGVAVWHVRECCDMLRSPPGQQGDRGPFSTSASAVTLMKDGLALVWSECFIMVMYGAAGPAPALGRVCVCTPLWLFG